jgi:hypothetical protein
LLLNRGVSSVGARNPVNAQTTTVAPRLVQPHLVQPQRVVESAASSMSINFQDLKMQLCDMTMQICQTKMQHGEISRNIADLKHDLNENGVGFGTLVVVLGLFAGVLAYLFSSSLLGIRPSSWIVPIF